VKNITAPISMLSSPFPRPYLAAADAERWTMADDLAWLDWAKRLRTMAQNGLLYSHDPYDIARYKEITEIALAMMAQGSGADVEQVRAVFAHETGHATPKLAVQTAVFRDAGSGTEILLVRELSDNGLWTMPGGWVDVGDSPSAAAAREVLEESGYIVRITRLLAVFDKLKHPHPPQAFHIHKLVFAADILGTDGTAGDGRETDGAAFFKRGALPPLSLQRNLPSQIDQLFALHAAGDGAPTYFD
jgi:ADP-ribose pyrophosphatase YjhB (NUDIX family)